MARVRSALLFGTVLALMTLGGNAEMAYHAVLLAAMYAAWLWRRGHADKTLDSIDDRKLDRRRLVARIATCRPALLILAAAVGLALSAVQVLPSIELTRRSGRAPSTVARTIFELPGRVGPDQRPFGGTDASWADGLTCRRLEPGTHHEQVYHFSVGPWRLAEYLWPNFGGRQFPRHRRWLEIVPGEGRIWVPSLYMGLVPLVLALAAMRLRRGSPRESWLSWVVVLSVVASFGWYGLGWLGQEIRVGAGADASGPPLVGAPFGGLYWLMTVALPGYVYFRYPAKLLVIAALGLSLLAARGWDRAFDQAPVRLRRSLLWLGGLSLLAAAAVLAARPVWSRWLADVPPNVMFGPLDERGAVADLFVALLQTALLCGLFWWLLGRAAKGARWTRTAALVLVAVDLAVANGWMVACAPAGQWRRQPKLAAVLEQDASQREPDQPYRVFRHPIWMPRSWYSRASPTRLAEAMQWDRDTLWPKYNLAASTQDDHCSAIPVAEVEGTMKPFDYQVFLWVAKRGVSGRGGSGALPAPGLSAFGAKYVILRGTDRPPDLEPIDLEGTEAQALQDVSLWHNPAHLPRTWIVHDVDVLAPVASDDPLKLWRRTEQVLFADGRWRDLRRWAVVETVSETGGSPFSATGYGREGSRAKKARVGLSVEGEETCRVVRHEPLCVEIEAELERPGLVVLCDQFYPGWRLEVATEGEGRRDVPLLRANRVMRGAWLPAGRHRLTYRYRPAGFLWGAWLSGLGWIGLAVFGAGVLLVRRLRAGRADRQRGS